MSKQLSVMLSVLVAATILSTPIVYAATLSTGQSTSMFQNLLCSLFRISCSSNVQTVSLTIYAGNSATVLGHTVKVIDVKSDGSAVVTVDAGAQTTITKYCDKNVGGLFLMVLKSKSDSSQKWVYLQASNKQTPCTQTITIYSGDSASVYGHTLKLIDVKPKDSVIVSVDNGSNIEVTKASGKKNVNGLYVEVSKTGSVDTSKEFAELILSSA